MAFALASAHAGIKVRIVDKRPARSVIQKATGVAQGIWNQLEVYGVTSAVIHDALPMRHFVFHDDEHLVADVPVPLVNGKPPAHLYPQSSLEEAMEHALRSYGIAVEYGTTFHELDQSDCAARVTLFGSDGGRQVVDVDWLIGADGSHSDVRTYLGMAFVGKDYPEEWSVAEVSTNQWPAEIQAQLFLRSNGVGLFLSRPSHHVIQGILNDTGAFAAIAKRFPDAILHYERQFKASLRRVQSPRNGRTWLIGDAAHTQSPVGGQGLNLAIWDGITLGKALAKTDLSVESRLATRAKKVLFFTDFDYRMLATRSRVIRLLRNRFWALASQYPLFARWFFKLISGVW